MSNLIKTRGIVLHYIRFKESSIIVKIFTQKLGLRSYIVNGVRSGKAKSNKIAYYQPLTILDLIVYEKEHANLHRISETKTAFPYSSIPFDPLKGCIALFLVELLGKCLKEENENDELYSFIEESLKRFDILSEHDCIDFHLHFMLYLCSFLGFAPHEPDEIIEQVGWHFGDEQHKKLQFEAFFHGQDTQLNGNLRSEFLEIMMKFYALHLDNFGEMKSLPILKTILR